MPQLMRLGCLLLLAAACLGGCSSQKDLYEPSPAPVVSGGLAVQRLWSRHTGGVTGFYSRLSPSLDSSSIYMAGRDGDVYAFDKLSGERLWHVDLDDEEENRDRRSARLSGGVTAYAGRVALGSENGYVYVLSAADGQLLWKHYLGAEVLTRPVFSKSGDRLFVLDSQGRLSALEAASGTLVYISGESTSPLRLRVQSVPVPVGDEYVLVGRTNGKILVMLQATGAVVNQITVAQAVGINALQRIADVASSPLLSGSDMFATSYQGGFVEYSFERQAITRKLGYSSSLDVAMDDEVFVIVQDDGHVFCVSRTTSQELWSNMQLSYRRVTAPVIYGGYVVVGDYEGYLYFLSLEDGSLAARLSGDGSAVYTAALSDGSNLYVSTAEGTLSCYRYDPEGLALQKSMALQVQHDYAGLGVDMRAPGAGDSGIYVPPTMSREELMERRRHIIQAVAQMEARQRAAQRQQEEYELRRKAYEEERRRRISGFGIAPGIVSSN